jgi:CubicO group peptidase (beta-lactamase class C family)
MSKTSRVFVAAVVLALSAQLAAQSAPQAERAGTLAEAVDLYRRAVEQDHLRGAVLYVAQHGRTVLHEALGYRHHAYGVPMLPDSMFRMASNTKPVVATAVMMLAEEGKLSIDDPVAKHLASFANPKSRGITIAQLLSHTSGLRIEPIFYPFAQGEEASLKSAAAKFGAEGPAAPPGSYSYSNAGYNTLGAVIEQVSGMPLETFLRTRIYDPLGMVDTLNHEDPAKLQRMATVYRGRREADGRVTFTQRWTPGDRPDYPVIRASGGMISTAADYAKFLEMFRNRGVHNGTRLLTEATVKAMITPRVKTADDGWYGYGWMIAADGSYSHTGSDGTMAWVDPARGIVGMVLTQSPGGINPRTEFRRKVEAALPR